LAEVSKYAKEELVYIDESGIDQYLQYPWGYGLRGDKVFGEISGKRFDRESFIAGKVGGKIIAPMCFKGTCNTELFNVWIEQVLTPELKPGQVVIMDNATFHKSHKTKELIESLGCRLLFLPPYSPDLNPIEKFWANFKAKIKSIIVNFNNLSDAIDYVFIAYSST
jgi:transposase